MMVDIQPFLPGFDRFGVVQVWERFAWVGMLHVLFKMLQALQDKWIGILAFQGEQPHEIPRR